MVSTSSCARYRVSSAMRSRGQAPGGFTCLVEYVVRSAVCLRVGRSEYKRVACVAKCNVFECCLLGGDSG